MDINFDSFYLDLPDIEAIKVFRSDQTYKYIAITKETTAREAVRSALLEFGFSEVERNVRIYRSVTYALVNAFCLWSLTLKNVLDYFKSLTLKKIL